MSGFDKEKGPVKILARRLAVLAVALAAAPWAVAQSDDAAEAPTYDATAYDVSAAPAEQAYSQPELDQMLAPIALYPDELLSQVLMASTYPLEVVQAARWSRANPGLQGDDAVSAVDSMDWDPSVKSLVAFPDVLAQMDQNLDWTQNLGEAFLAQQDGVMASVQRLRSAAMQADNLATNDQMVVSREGTDIAIDSPSPDTMYVPYYDPRQVYGTWWWPSYPPVYWAPWPGYYLGGSAFAFTVGIPVGVDFFFGDFDWRRHHLRVFEHHPFYTHEHHRDSRDHQWRWDPSHRRGVQFHNPVARAEFASATTPRAPRTSIRAPRAASTPSQGQGAGFFPIERPQPRSQAQRQPLARPPQGMPRIARPPAAPQFEQRQQLVAPQQQPLARPAVPQGARVPQQGVHLVPRFQRPAQPAPQAPQIVHPLAPVVHPMPQPAQPLARPMPPARAPEAQGREEGPREGARGEGARGAGR